MGWTTWLVALLLAQVPAAFETSLSGRVETLGSGAPVAYAEVILAPVGGGSVDGYRTTIADAAGRFTFKPVPAGSFRVHAERQGYLRGEAGSRTPGITGTPVSVAQGQRPATVVISLTPTNVISGRILDEDGPARGALVRALRIAYRDGEQWTETAAAAAADDRGEYRLFGLAPGSYVVVATPSLRPRIEGDQYVMPQVASNANGNRQEIRVPLQDALTDGNVAPVAYEIGAYLPTLYPGTIDDAAAIPIEVSGGTAAPGIEIVMRRSRGVTVRGRVIAAAGTSPDGPSVGVRRLGSSSLSLPVVREANGGFLVRDVPPGRYELTSRSLSPVALYGRTTIEVADSDIADATVVLTPGLRVSGHLVIDGERRLPADATVGVQLVARSSGVSMRQVAADGSFTFENVAPQDYWLRIQARGRTLAPMSIRFGADPVRDGIVTVTPERQADELEIAVTLRTGSLDASITDRNQRAVSGASVALVPDEARRRYSGLLRTASTDANGRVQFNDVAPGTYTLMAGDVPPGEWLNPGVLQRFERTGTVLRIEPDARQRISMVVP